MRAIITGASGFVGRHLTETLAANGHEVVAYNRAEFQRALPLGLDNVDVVFHLAGQSFVPESIASPLETYETNIMGTARIARAITNYAKTTGKGPRVIFASSGEVYGNVPFELLPITEETRTNPHNPYAASKAAAEALLLAEYWSFGLDVVIARVFNAIGPRQNTRFAIADFAAQLRRIGDGAPARIAVGNLDAQRDFLDVRDVAAAYLALAERGASGGIYNICSGKPQSLRSLLHALIEISGMEVEILDDPLRMRPTDTPVVVGANFKLCAETGWQPRRSLTTTLEDTLACSRENERVDRTP